MQDKTYRVARGARATSLLTGLLALAATCLAGIGVVEQTEDDKLVASDAANGDEAATSVSIYGDIIVVGAPYETANGTDAGAAYVFRRGEDGSWSEEDKLTPTDAALSAEFGFSVAAGTGVVVIGARAAVLETDPAPAGEGGGAGPTALLHDTAPVAARPQIAAGVAADPAGAAYIFRDQGDGTWAQVDKLTADDAGPRDEFGYAVAIVGDVALVGARLEDEGGSNAGSAYVFRNLGGDNWVQEDKLIASDAATGDQAGRGVALSEGVAIVGVVGDDDDGATSGSAYIYRDQGDGTWAEEDKLTASDAAAGDFFGAGVGISGSLAMVGAPTANSAAGGNAGKAYFFRDQGDGTWLEEQLLTAPDAAAQDQFGFAVAIRGNVAVIGAAFDDDPVAGGDAGSTYVFRRPAVDWIDSVKLVASDRAGGDKLGTSVAIASGTTVSGAPFDDTSTGGAYVHVIGLPGDIDGNGLVDANDIFAMFPAWGDCPGCPEDTNGDGVVNVTDLLLILAQWT